MAIRSKVWFGGGVALTLALGAGIIVSGRAETSVIRACADSKGMLRLLTAGAACGRRETLVSWNSLGLKDPRDCLGPRACKESKASLDPKVSQGYRDSKVHRGQRDRKVQEACALLTRPASRGSCGRNLGSMLWRLCWRPLVLFTSDSDAFTLAVGESVIEDSSGWMVHYTAPNCTGTPLFLRSTVADSPLSPALIKNLGDVYVPDRTLHPYW